MVVKVYISEGEFSQISIEFLEMLFIFSNLLGSSSSSSSSNASNSFSFLVILALRVLLILVILVLRIDICEFF